GYDIIHFIGTYVLNFLVEGRLKRAIIVHSLHESIDRVLDLEPSRLKRILFGFQFNILRKKGLRLIFHSENVRKQYLNTFKKDPDQTRVIPFGLFEGYENFAEDDALIPEFTPYFLFVGYIHPYKGVDLLISAAQSLRDKKIQIPILIAGKDATEIEKRYVLPDNIQFINKFLSESEIITLIKKSYAIVLPYTSASQSGIPNTCFCFDKPVIASDLDGIKDVVHDKVNGLLFESGNVHALEESMHRLWTDKKLYKILADNIRKKVNIEWTDWKRIAELTMKYYEKNI
ncbi:MAG: glycosyltransferase family 4 protein, partial [Anaerolineales bacterium]